MYIWFAKDINNREMSFGFSPHSSDFVDGVFSTEKLARTQKHDWDYLKYGAIEFICGRDIKPLEVIFVDLKHQDWYSYQERFKQLR